MPRRIAVPVLITASTLLAPAAAGAEELVAYGSRVGMEVTVTGRSGTDSEAAVVEVVHTRDNARAMCKGYLSDSSEACIDTAMADVAARIGDRIVGNCRTGVFTSLWGSEFRFVGRLAQPTELGAEWEFHEVASGALLDGSTASAYDIMLSQFGAICPGRLAE